MYQPALSVLYVCEAKTCLQGYTYLRRCPTELLERGEWVTEASDARDLDSLLKRPPRRFVN
jgi:hypothetical protein